MAIELSRRSSVRVRSASAISPGVRGSNKAGSAWATSGVRCALSRVPGRDARVALADFAFAFGLLAGLRGFFADAMTRTIHAFRSAAGLVRPRRPHAPQAPARVHAAGRDAALRIPLGAARPRRFDDVGRRVRSPVRSHGRSRGARGAPAAGDHELCRGRAELRRAVAAGLDAGRLRDQRLRSPRGRLHRHAGGGGPAGTSSITTAGGCARWPPVV